MMRSVKKSAAALSVAVFIIVGGVYNLPRSSTVRDRRERKLQFDISSLLPSLDLSRLPSFLSDIIPFYEPKQYPLQDPLAFVLHYVCTDINREGCDESNTIRFVNVENPPPNGFRYHDSGPLQMQGVFWTKQRLLADIDVFDLVGNSDLASYARTRHGAGVQTGNLQTDENGFEYVTRPLGDHSWSTSANAPNTYLSAYDALYLFDLTEGTMANPLKFDIIISFKAWFDCVRFNFGTTFSAAAKFEQILITDPNDPIKQKYPGSVVWVRRSTYLGAFSVDYEIIQVVDGSGRPIYPAWSEFQQSTHVTIVSGLLPDRLNERQEC